MEHTSELVKLGRLIEETSYDRRSENDKQILLGSIRIDYVNKNKKIIYETKLSSKNLDISIWQMKYYLYIIAGGRRHSHSLCDYWRLSVYDFRGQRRTGGKRQTKRYKCHYWYCYYSYVLRNNHCDC